MEAQCRSTHATPLSRAHAERPMRTRFCSHIVEEPFYARSKYLVPHSACRIETESKGKILINTAEPVQPHAASQKDFQ